MESEKDYYKKFSTDELAHALVAMKESAAAARRTCYFIEDELRDRLLTNKASVLLGTEWKVKGSVEREIMWDQEALHEAGVVAYECGLGDLFEEAFPLKFDCSVRNLNILLKVGGRTADAIEGAKIEVKEKTKITVEGAK